MAKRRVFYHRAKLRNRPTLHNRVSSDTAPHANALLEMLDDIRVVWGSDWPHTQHEESTCYFETQDAAFPVRALSDITAEKALYGIAPV
ncbi:amidohydrolase family protein [uncultured Shimia sp.]|uniref:amidohydrolase family protein n=1 Tax=uncultured Shimia sp. TaxID=573152 RepID=UPI002623A46B|nr:amidohydrolase family protein [uncultured Shimia sp.]